MHRLRCFGLCSWLLCFFGTSPSFATSVQTTSLADMIQKSDVIVLASVGTPTTSEVKDNRHIITTTPLHILQTIKGNSSERQLQLYQVGGDTSTMSLHISGASTFYPHEKIVFFGKRFKHYVVPFGIGLGKYIVRNNQGKEELYAEYGHVQFLEKQSNGTYKPAQAPSFEPRLLQDFIRDVKHHLNAKGVKP